MSFLAAMKRAFNIEWDVKVNKLPYSHALVGFSTNGNYPIFLSDDLVFVRTKIADMPQAFAVATVCGAKEIYVNNAFLSLPREYQEAVINHEVGHLALNAIYTSWERFLTTLRISNKALLCEYAADDFSNSCGSDILGALEYLRYHYPKLTTPELDKRIVRLQGRNI